MDISADAKSLRAVVRDQGRSLVWLARTTGYSYSYVTKVAGGSEKASPAFLRAASAALGEEVVQ